MGLAFGSRTPAQGTPFGLFATSVLIGRAFAQSYSELVHLSRRPAIGASGNGPHNPAWKPAGSSLRSESTSRMEAPDTTPVGSFGEAFVRMGSQCDCAL